jgi:hypothetical protein
VKKNHGENFASLILGSMGMLEDTGYFEKKNGSKENTKSYRD